MYFDFSFIIFYSLSANSSNINNLPSISKCCQLICTSLIPITILSTQPLQGTLAYTNEDYRVTVNREYLFKIKSALDQVAQGINADSNTNELYEDIDKITTKAQMIERIFFLTEYYNQNQNSCHKTAGTKAIEDKNIIFEYFSISNDGKKKVMISDAYPGQKLKFIQQGLSVLRSDLQQFLLCPY